MADRIRTLLSRVERETDLTVTGGVTMKTGLMDVPARRLGVYFRKPDEPQIAAALSAALRARARAVFGKRP